MTQEYDATAWHKGRSQEHDATTGHMSQEHNRLATGNNTDPRKGRMSSRSKKPSRKSKAVTSCSGNILLFSDTPFCVEWERERHRRRQQRGSTKRQEQQQQQQQQQEEEEESRAILESRKLKIGTFLFFLQVWPLYPYHQQHCQPRPGASYARSPTRPVTDCIIFGRFVLCSLKFLFFRIFSVLGWVLSWFSDKRILETHGLV